jgi:hypothetical protein
MIFLVNSFHRKSNIIHQHVSWIASQIVVQHHTSFKLPSHDAVGGPWLLGSGHFVQLCLKTPRFGAHASCSSCWESHLFLLTKKRVTATGCPEARKCDAGPRVVGNNTLGISFTFGILFLSLLVPFSLTFLCFNIPFLHSVFLFQFRKQYTRLNILLQEGFSIGNIAEQRYYFLNHLGVHSGLIATSACIRMPCTFNTGCSHIRIAWPVYIRRQMIKHSAVVWAGGNPPSGGVLPVFAYI